MEINQYSLTATDIQDQDFYDVDYWNGTTWVTHKISGATLKEKLGTVAKREVIEFINKTGAPLTKGTIVYLKTSSSSAAYPEVVKATASTEVGSSKTVGAVYEDVSNDAVGLIVTSGEVANLDTAGYNVGDRLWLSTVAGEVTTTMPTAPNHAVFIGTVTRSQNTNGRVLYHIQNGFELQELHNVSITGTPNNGDALIYDLATSLWKARKVAESELTFTDITTNDVSTAKHGFAPKAPNDTTKFLRGDGTWAVPAAGGLTNFTEAENTSAPNGTVPVNSLTATGAATNIDAAIVPKGTGAFMLDIPDNTAAGGNKRGANAVDLQTDRSNANQVASGQWSFAAGRSNRASGNYDVALGVETVASGGLGAMAVGYGVTASGVYSYAMGYANGASGSASAAIGYGNTASGNYSFSAGAANVASGAQSVAMGNTNIANAENSTAFGYYSHVFGVRGRWVTGQVNSTPGDCQKSIFCLSTRTTNNTATTLLSGFGAGAPSATNQVILSNQSAYRFKGTIIGKKSGTTDTAAWDIDGLIVRGANAASTTLVVSNVNVVDNTPAWGTPTLAADTTNGGLQVQVTGAAATNIQWTAVIETTEVIYA